MERIPVIYDTDLGEDIDDLYALYLTLFHPALDLLAVTTVHGDTLRKARLAKKVLRAAGRDDIPVAAGVSMSEERIRRGQRVPDPTVSATYVTYVTEKDTEWGLSFPEASELIRQILNDADALRPVALIGEGAFSNLGNVVQKGSARQRSRIRCFALMGGETQSVMSEYNVLCDPEAADFVLASGAPVFLATFQLTSRLRMTMDEVKRYFGANQHPVLRTLYECTKIWAGRTKPPSGPVLYDLVPVLWLGDPSCVQTRRTTVRVELEGTYTRGQTVRLDEGPEANVSESVDLNPHAMIDKFIKIIMAATT